MSRDAEDGHTPQEEALANEIERTRQELGETVEALAAKADVKGRAQRRATELAGTVRGTAHALKDKVAEQAGELRTGAAAKAGQAKDAALATSAPVRGQVTARAAEAGRTVRGVTPEPVRRSADRAARGLRAHRGTAAAAAGALILAWLAIRWLRR